jgi:transcriptional regulator with XRE-family HTH domain
MFARIRNVLYCEATMGLAENIRRAREAAGYGEGRRESAAAFARLIGKTSSQLTDWEQGRNQLMRLDNLIRIALGARVPVGDLLPNISAEYDAMVNEVSQTRENSHFRHTLNGVNSTPLNYSAEGNGTGPATGISTGLSYGELSAILVDLTNAAHGLRESAATLDRIAGICTNTLTGGQAPGGEDDAAAHAAVAPPSPRRHPSAHRKRARR